MTQEFKKGDRVQRKESAWTWQSAGSHPQLPKDGVFKVKEYIHADYYPSISFEHTGDTKYDAAFFELVLEKSPQRQLTPKYYVGTRLIRNLDSAKVKADLKDNGWSEGYWRFLNGSHGVVSEVQMLDNCGCNYKVMVEGTCDSFWMSQDEDTAVEFVTYTLGQGVKAVGSTIEVEQGANGSGGKPDLVNSPKHYSVFETVEAIQVIASAMTQDQFFGYCLGNILKYRLRAGSKDDVMQELSKADKYQELFTQYKYLCKEV